MISVPVINNVADPGAFFTTSNVYTYGFDIDETTATWTSRARP